MPKLEGEAGLFCGQSRYGKTTAVIEHVKGRAPGRRSRVLVWSIKEQVDDYAGKLGATAVTRTRRGLVAALEKAGSGPAVIVHVPKRASEFGFWSRCAMWWAKAGARKGEHTSIIAEELADVTSPAKAPEGWGELVRQGLGYGANVYGVSQRPAESDKTLPGNATFLHTHYLRRKGDRTYVADELDTDPGRIQRLAKYQWLEAWAGEPTLREGQTAG